MSEASLHERDRSSRTFWALGRLRPGVSADQAQAAVNATRSGADTMAVLRYTGMTADVSGGMARIGGLLRVAGAAVFFIACANVASFLLARALRPLARDIGSRRARRQSWPARSRPALGQRSHLGDRRCVRHAAGRVDDVHRSGALLRTGCRASRLRSGSRQHGCRVSRVRRHHDRLRSHAALRSATRRPGGRASTRKRGPVERDAPPARRSGRGADGLLLRARRLDGPAPRGFSQRATDHCRPSSRPADSRHGRSAPRLRSSRSRPRILPGSGAGGALVAGHLGDRMGRNAAGRAAGVAVAAHRTSAVAAPRRDDGRGHVHPTHARARHDAADRRADVRRKRHAADVQGRHRQRRGCPPSCSMGTRSAALSRTRRASASRSSAWSPAGSRRRRLDRLARRSTTTRSRRERLWRRTARRGFAFPRGSTPSSAMLDANVVSRSYFDAMGLSPMAGSVFPDDPEPRRCRVGVINQEAAELYFGGNAVGGAVIDSAGRRTEIVGVVHSTLLRTAQRRVEPTIYFPMAQDFLPRMTLILGARETNEAMLASVAPPPRGRARRQEPGRGDDPRDAPQQDRAGAGAHRDGARRRVRRDVARAGCARLVRRDGRRRTAAPPRNRVAHRARRARPARDSSGARRRTATGRRRHRRRHARLAAGRAMAGANHAKRGPAHCSGCGWPRRSSCWRRSPSPACFPRAARWRWTRSRSCATGGENERREGMETTEIGSPQSQRRTTEVPCCSPLTPLTLW